ncbi:hypothetical protein COY95_04960 [Candidatus Woesearchaeota archaeon CG_4_10_14_0_8_um_filter_47_5]|nr:MAG: hypothetical protein COY95_04960 [Candidatus Woesearchaeota archaeon CG_4_10_14_0_8_um_filter_47_5]
MALAISYIELADAPVGTPRADAQRSVIFLGQEVMNVQLQPGSLAAKMLTGYSQEHNRIIGWLEDTLDFLLTKGTNVLWY